MDIKQQLKVQIRVKWSIERSNAVVPWLCNTANSGPSLGSLRPSYHSSSWGWSCALCTANPSQHLTVWVFHVAMRDNFISSPSSHLAVLSLPLPLILLQRLCHSWAPSCFLRYRRRSTSLPRYLTSSLYAETLGDIYVRLHSSSIYHLGRKCMNDIVSRCRWSMRCRFSRQMAATSQLYLSHHHGRSRTAVNPQQTCTSDTIVASILRIHSIHSKKTTKIHQKSNESPESLPVHPEPLNNAYHRPV